MTTMTQTKMQVIGGVDTHGDVHVAAAIDQLGCALGTASFPTTVAWEPPDGAHLAARSASWSGSGWREPVRGVRACAATWPAKAWPSLRSIVRTVRTAAGGGSPTRSMPKPPPVRR